MQFLLKSAHEQMHSSPELSRHLILELFTLACAASLRLPQRLLQRLCSTCGAILVPGATSRVSTCNNKRKRKGRAQRRALRVQCLACCDKHDFPLPPKPSSRLAASVPGSGAQSGLQGKRNSRQRVDAAARSAALPAAQELPKDSRSTPTGGDMFGFDFVALR